MPAPRARAALLAGPPLLFLALFLALPLAATLRAAFDGADAWRWLALHPYVRGRVAGALLQAAVSAAATIAVAIPLALLHHRWRIPFSRLHLAVHAAPFVLPVFVVVLGLRAVLGSGGLVEDATGVDVLGAIGPFGAVVVAHVYYNYGFAARLLHAALERRPVRLEEAARTLGAGRTAAAARVTLPLLLPALASVALLAFLFAFGSFGVVLYLGGGEISTFETLLYENLGGAFPATDRAAALGLAQLAVNGALLWGYLRLQRRAERVPRDPPQPRSDAGRAVRAAAWLALAAGALPALAVLVGGFRVRGAWTLEPWTALLDASHPSHLGGFDLAQAVQRSVSYAMATALFSLLLAALLAYALRDAQGPWRSPLEAAAALPLGTSSLLVGLGSALAYGASGFLDLRGRTELIVAAHVLIAFPFVARVLLPAMAQHDRRLDEAAATLGAGPLAVARRVHLPLFAAPLAAAGGLAAAVSLGDFGASLVLMRPGTASVAVWIDRHGGVGAFDPLLRAQSVALAGLLLVLTLLAYAAAGGFRRSGGGLP